MFTSADTDFAIVIGERFVTLIKAVPEIDPAKVHFARAYEIQPDELPCISVELGPDTPFESDGKTHSNFTDSQQIIYVDLYDHQNDAEAVKRITFQRALVHKAVQDDYTIGLPFVEQVLFGGAIEPISDIESGLPGWVMRVPFPVNYRFNDNDRTVFNTG